MQIPKIKKKLSAYILGEDGKISKHNLMVIGAFLGSAAIAGILSAQDAQAGDVITHGNDLSLTYPAGGQATATHTHHASHQSY